MGTDMRISFAAIRWLLAFAGLTTVGLVPAVARGAAALAGGSR